MRNSEFIGDEPVNVTLTLKLDLGLLREQKRVLIGIAQDTIVTGDQEEAAEGMINLIDFIQDEILAQGLPSDEQIFRTDTCQERPLADTVPTEM
jgi:hypothetical protein